MDLKQIAERLLLSSITEGEILEDWEYRKGKNVGDISHAILKAKQFKNGRGKFEFEANMLEVYLKVDVLKKRRNSNGSHIKAN